MNHILVGEIMYRSLPQTLRNIYVDIYINCLDNEPFTYL